MQHIDLLNKMKDCDQQDLRIDLLKSFLDETHYDVIGFDKSVDYCLKKHANPEFFFTQDFLNSKNPSEAAVAKLFQDFIAATPPKPRKLVSDAKQLPKSISDLPAALVRQVVLPDLDSLSYKQLSRVNKTFLSYFAKNDVHYKNLIREKFRRQGADAKAFEQVVRLNVIKDFKSLY